MATAFKFRRLEQYRVGGTSSLMHLALPRGQTPRGMVAQRCPSVECAPADFRLGRSPDFQGERPPTAVRHPGTAGTTCPYCGHSSDDSDFVEPTDRQAAVELVRREAIADVEEHFSKMLDDLARRSRGMIKVTKRTKPRLGHSRSAAVAQHKDLLRAIVCDLCQRPYAVHPPALFCPDCGSGNLQLHLACENDLLLESLKEADDSAAAGRREKAFRILANAHEDVVSMLEGYLKLLFTFLITQRLSQADRNTALAHVKNSFQNIERTRERFRSLDLDPYAILSDTDLRLFASHLAARHIVGHNLGIVDSAYLRRGGVGRVGEPVNLDVDSVEWFAELSIGVILHTAAAFSECRVPQVPR